MALHFSQKCMWPVEQRGCTFLPRRIVIGERQVLFARLAVDREQVIHERNGALDARIGRLSFRLHLDGIDEPAPGVVQAARTSILVRKLPARIEHEPDS